MLKTRPSKPVRTLQAARGRLVKPAAQGGAGQAGLALTDGISHLRLLASAPEETAPIGVGGGGGDEG